MYKSVCQKSAWLYSLGFGASFCQHLPWFTPWLRCRRLLHICAIHCVILQEQFHLFDDRPCHLNSDAPHCSSWASWVLKHRMSSTQFTKCCQSKWMLEWSCPPDDCPPLRTWNSEIAPLMEFSRLPCIPNCVGEIGMLLTETMQIFYSYFVLIVLHYSCSTATYRPNLILQQHQYQQRNNGNKQQGML